VEEVPIVTAAVAYDCPTTYNTYILFFHQSLHFPTLNKHLLCPNQLRDYQVTVNSTPLLYISHEDRKPIHHSIVVSSPDLHIPLQLEGTTSAFPVRKPTDDEVRSDVDCIHVHMTSDSTWNPHSPEFAKDEAAIKQSLESMPCERGRSVQSTISTTSPLLRPSSPTDVMDFDMKTIMDFDHLIANRSIGFTSTKKRPGFVTAEQLSKRWHIGLETAKKTIEKTTQLAVRDFSNATGTRRLKPYAQQLRWTRLKCPMYSDIMYGPCVSLQGNKYAVVFCTDFHWIYFYPIAERKHAHYSLDDLFRRYGVPIMISPDNAKELTEGEFKKKVQKAGSYLKPIEAHTPNQNIAESGIREIKRQYKRTMIATNTPDVLWDLCIQHLGLIRSHTALNIHSLHGEVPASMIAGDTVDISALCEFSWYEWVWYLGPSGKGDNMETKFLGRYCGHSFDVGDTMCSRILTSKAKLIARSSVFPLTVEDRNSPEVDQRKLQCEASLKESLGKRYKPTTEESFSSPWDDDGEDDDGIDANNNQSIWDDTPTHEPYEPCDPNDKPEPALQEADDMDLEAFDRYLAAKVLIPQGDQKSFGTVKRRKRDSDGNLIGKSHENPVLDTSLYEVEFDSGEVEAYTANIIAEHIYAQVDDSGHTTFAVSEIVDHRCDESALRASNAPDAAKNGKFRPRTTRGWQICAQLNDGSSIWVPLKDMKDAHPIELAEYAVRVGIDHEPAFSWWVPHTLRKRDRVVKAIRKRYFRTHQKFGIELPKTVKRALEIDKETGTTFWRDALRKEMNGVAVAFEILDEDDDDPLVGYTKINCHIVFDTKAGSLQRKCRLVAGGHMTGPPADITFASVVSRESVRIAFLLAALNGLELEAADIGNAFLNAPCREKIWIRCGPEFGPLEGRRAKVVRALYGLKSSGAAWRAHLAKVLRDELEFEPCKADNDVWMRPAVKPDKTPYYEYVLVYTDDILCLSMKPHEILSHLDQCFLLKPDSIGKPNRYLGATVKEWDPEGSDYCKAWAMGSEQYVKEAIRNVKLWLDKRGLGLKTKASGVLPSNYKPELDSTPYLDDEDFSYYQQQIGVLRWMVELGRIDICAEVSIMAGFLAAPRVGHLEAVMHMFAYLNLHERSHLVFDPSYVPHQAEPTPDWSDFYEGATELKPPDAPEPRGRSVQMTTFVDSDHAGDQVSRRSRTGVLIFLNRSPIVWHSKKQNSIESSSFGSEFTAMKVGVELSEGLRYKLRMMGVPLDGPTHVKADNMSVIKNSSLPESVLKKKSNSICYHYVRERAAAGVIVVSYEPTESNLADMLTKIQPGPVRQRLARMVLF